MEYFDKYQKYKNKYLELKYKQSGGAKIPHEVCFPTLTTPSVEISISFEYDCLADEFIYNIYNFKIRIGTNDIRLVNQNFRINKYFFNKYLKNPSSAVIDKYRKKEKTKFNFDNCEILNTPFTSAENFRVVDSDENEDNCIKRFIESYFRKNICIIIQNQTIMTQSIVYFHGLMTLYIMLTIIHNYFKIEETKLRDLDVEKYQKIYKSIPKYIESNIDNHNILFRSDNNSFINLNEDRNGINNLKIIFDTGNSTNTFVSPRFMIYLGYYNADGTPKRQYMNNQIFEKFLYNIQGVTGNESGISKLVFLSFKFNDPRLDNDKIYNINCIIKDNATTDILLGQTTMQQLYDDGYSIKWYKSANLGKTFRSTKSIIYDEFKNVNFDDTIFYKLLERRNSGEEIQELLPSLETIVDTTISFIQGNYFEINNIRPIDLIRIKENICLFLIEINTRYRSIKSTFYDLMMLRNNEYNQECIESIFLN